MESRQSRASSRYASPAVFNGPVRRWKKQWVTSTQNRTNKRNDAPPLLLCRWTPLAAAADDPPRRRFRYTPVVPIEKGKLIENELVRGGSIRNDDIISQKEEEEAAAIEEVNEDADGKKKKSVQEEEEEEELVK